MGRLGACACACVLAGAGCQQAWYHHTRASDKEKRQKELMQQRRLSVSLQMAKIKLDQGDLAASQRHIQEVLDANPRLPEAHLIVGQIAMARSDLDRALESLKRAIELNGNLAEAYACLGFVHQRQGDREKALQAFDRAARLDPDQPSYRLGLAASHAAVNQRDEAEAVLVQAVERFDQEPELHEALGELFAMKQQYRKALDHLRRAISLDPRNVHARRTKAYVHYWMGQHGEARKAFEALMAVENYEPGPDVLATVADCEMKLDHPADAIRFYERACQLAPDDANLHLMRGHCYLRLHNVPAAIQAYRRTIARGPDLAEGYYALGFALFRQGKLREALVQYERAAKRDAASPVIHFLMGCAYRKLGCPEDARRAFLRALELDPRYDLARAYLQRGGPGRRQLH